MKLFASEKLVIGFWKVSEEFLVWEKEGVIIESQSHLNPIQLMKYVCALSLFASEKLVIELLKSG